MKRMITKVLGIFAIVGTAIPVSAEQITRHVDEWGFEDWYWICQVAVKRGEAHTFWIKDLTENTAIFSLDVSCDYDYIEDGETYEESIWTSESCEAENALGGWDKYQLFSSNEWEYVHTSVSSLTFTVRVEGWEPDSAADARFTFGHSSGDDEYPERDAYVETALPDGGPYSEEIGGTEETAGITWEFMVTSNESIVVSCDVRDSYDLFDGMGRMLEIPEVLGGHPVTAIDDFAFYNEYYILGVTIPSSVRRIGDSAFSLCCGLEEVTIPSSVEQIGASAFADCDGLTSLTIKSGVKGIGDYAFSGCTGLTSVVVPATVTHIGKNAFYGCSGLTTVTISTSSATIGEGLFGGCGNVTSVKVPGEYALSYLFPDAFGKIRSVQVVKGSRAICEHAYDGCSSLMSVTVQTDVMRVGKAAFQDCNKLSKVVFQGNAPDLGAGVFGGTPQALTITVPDDSTGWSTPGSTALPVTWGGRVIATVSGTTASGTSGGNTSSGGSSFTGTIVVTNVVIHYVVNSVQPNLAVPLTADTKFVNVMTEVKGGNVAIPDTWAANYPTFASKYGSDFTAALTKTTGKVDAAGNPMYVWQDYVAGTDPTKEDDVFTASITLVDGVPVISYTPELTAEQKALRVYKTFGKKQLQDTEWTDITDLGGEAKKPYNFFKVTVEMK